MHPNLPSPVPPRIDLVYAKTAAGRHELAHRGAGLTARQRTALIMLDGQRDAASLATVMPAAEVTSVLAALVALGLIVAPLSSSPHSPAPVPAAPGLDAIKAALIGAAETYLGVMASDVVTRVRQAGDAAQLLRMLGHWHMAMQASKHGKDAAATLLEETRAALQAA